MVDIGKKIKELRLSQKMTQSEFAERLGVAKSSISSYENGSRLPSYDILLKMARVFRVSTDVLLGRSEENTISLDVTGLTKEQLAIVKDLIGNYQKLNIMQALLPEELKKQAEQFLETGKLE